MAVKTLATGESARQLGKCGGEGFESEDFVPGIEEPLRDLADVGSDIQRVSAGQESKKKYQQSYVRIQEIEVLRRQADGRPKTTPQFGDLLYQVPQFGVPRELQALE